MISQKDSANFSLSLIARSFKKNGHSVDIYAPYLNYNVMRMFDEDIEIFDFNDLTMEVMEQYDILFSSVFSYNLLAEKKLLNVKKYIFTHDFLIHGELVNGGDFNFAPSLNNTMSEYTKELNFVKMGIGEPKFDSLNYIQQKESNKLLFIDSGHYPFGEKGKIELAKLLVSICEKFPNYQLVIKPRFLPTDEVFTHKNLVHLYDVISEVTNGAIPLNMELLHEHFDLEVLISESKTVICMYTTAYISALVANRGLIIVDDLPNEDTYDIRHKRFMQTRKGMVGTNALVHYTKVLDYLPEGIKSPTKHIKHELSQLANVSDKIVEVTEYIYHQYIIHNKFPENQWYEYENYKQTIGVRHDATWDTIISERYENTIKFRLLIDFDFRIAGKMNLDKITTYINGLKKSGLISMEKFNTIYRNISELKSAVIIENAEVMMKDDIDFSILLDTYFTQRKYDEIKKIEYRQTAAYWYFRGRIALEEKDWTLAKELLEAYLKVSLSRNYIKEKSDLDHYRTFAVFTLARLCIQEGNLKKAKEYVQLYERLDRNLQDNGLQDRERAYNRLQNNWLRVIVNGKLDLFVSKLPQNLMVYGAGSIAESIVVSTELMMNRVEVFIDLNQESPEKFGRRLIQPADIVDYPNINTVLVTVPHAFDTIKQNLLKIRDDLNVICLSQLIETFDE